MMAPPYKDSSGRWYTKALFFETSLPAYRDIFQPPFTLKEEDHIVDGITYKSAKQVFLSCNDPTEYAPAMELLGSFKHWKHLCNTSWFQSHIEEWREELEVKLRSEAVRAMRDTAINEGSKGTTAAKYLASKGWEDSRGRPSKKAIEKEAKIQERIHDELDEDIERMADHMRAH